MTGRQDTAEDRRDPTRRRRRRRDRPGLPGVVVAGITALISGLSVFVNSYGVHAVTSPSVYTTAKNLVATVVLAGVRPRRWTVAATGPALPPAVSSRCSTAEPSRRPTRPGASLRGAPWVGLAYVGIVGGGLAFVLFFDGLADTTATPAAFWRDTPGRLGGGAGRALPARTGHLVELAAIALLVLGEVAVAGGVGHLATPGGSCSSCPPPALGRRGGGGQGPCFARWPRPPSRWSAWAWVPSALVVYLVATGSSTPGLPRRHPGRLGAAHRATARRLRRHVDDGTGPGPRPRCDLHPGWRRAGHRPPPGRGRQCILGAPRGRAGAHRPRDRCRRLDGAPAARCGPAAKAVAGLSHPVGRPGGVGHRTDHAGTRSGEASTPGPVLFARYAYPPNSLGYCGPGDPSALLGAAAEGTDVVGLGHLAARFEGAWPYLQLLAACNGIRDPLDPRVVEAYWVGNSLLARVPASALMDSLSDRFERRAGRRFDSLIAAVPGGGIPQHSFHVFAVYPGSGFFEPGWTGHPWRSSTGAGSGGDGSRGYPVIWWPWPAGR